MANKRPKKPSGQIKIKHGLELGEELQRYFDNPPYIPPGKKFGFRWTSKAFSEAINVSDSIVRAWLRGDNLPSNNISGIISAIFGPKPEEFASEVAAFVGLLRRCERRRDGKGDESTAPIEVEADNRSKRLDGQLGPDTYVQATSIYRSPDTSLDFPLIFAPRLPPALYAEPAYIASHVFVGRQEQLAVLDAWAKPKDPNSMLLVTAMGGAGKSFLAWHWVNHGAIESQTNWAGRFWYSFYEPHASVRDFHCHLLSYMSGQPIDTFRRIDDVLLLATTMEQLRRAPWLVVLDGLERLLVHYHRMDAHYVDDAFAGTEDLIGTRDACAVIRGQDASFLRMLSSVAPSKVLVTTRLVPDCLLSSGHQPLPGVMIHDLAGLNPDDAYLMMRDNGISGDATTIADYLKVNFDCHPLVIGVLAGIISTYLPARCDFDAWVSAPEGGQALNLGEVDLVQRHNDILNHAIRGLSPDCNRVLSTIALLSGATDYTTIAAMVASAFIDDALPPNASQHNGNQTRFKRLQRAIMSLQRLGLLQYDGASDRYDLHPVVRTRVLWGMMPEERKQVAGLVIDHFSSPSVKPFQEAQELADIAPGMEILHALILQEDYAEAFRFYDSQLHNVICYLLDRDDVALSLLHPFFKHAWSELRDEINNPGNSVFNGAGVLLKKIGLIDEAYQAHKASLSCSLGEHSSGAVVDLLNLASTLFQLQASELAHDTERLALRFAEAIDHAEGIFVSHLQLFDTATNRGEYATAQAHWAVMDQMGRNWRLRVYRQGDAECAYARFLYYQGMLNEDALIAAEKAAHSPFSRTVRRKIEALRGEWRISSNDWMGAHDALLGASKLKSASRAIYDAADIQLLRVKLKLGEITPRSPILELIEPVDPAAEVDLAELRREMGDIPAAREHGKRAIEWCDGQGIFNPLAFVRARAIAILEQCT